MTAVVAGLVLGAGSSSRLGQPKQLLAYRDKPLLQTAVDRALAARFDQVIVAIGGAASEVREQVDFGSAVVTENVAFTSGCSSSIVAALAAVDRATGGLVLLLGDQPGVTIETIGMPPKVVPAGFRVGGCVSRRERTRLVFGSRVMSVGGGCCSCV